MKRDRISVFFQFYFWVIVHYLKRPYLLIPRFRQLVKNLRNKNKIYKEKLYLGSSDNKNAFYHGVPFKGEIDYCLRDSSPEKLRLLLLNEDFKNKRILDLGCNVGFFAFSLAGQAKEVVAIDHDEVAIRKAKELCKKYNIKNVKFIADKISVGLLKELGAFDVVLALSILPWINKIYKDPYKIWEQIYSNKTVYTELMYGHDGPAGMNEIKNDEDAKTLLRRFSSIVHPIGWTRGWEKDRTIWRSVKEFGKFSEYGGRSCSDVYLSEQFVKKSKKGFYHHSLFREYLALNRVKKEGITPIPVEVTEDYLIVNRLMGQQFDFNYPKQKAKKQFKRILKVLRDKKIAHRDIRPDNLFVGIDDNIYLLDFAWAVIDNDWYSAPKTLGGLYKVKDYDNEKYFDLILEKLKN